MLNETTGIEERREVTIPINGVSLAGDLVVPEHATGVVVFAHGSGSSRHSSRNRAVAGVLQRAGFATVLMDLLTPHEERIDAVTGHLRFDIPLLAARLAAATDWATTQERALASLPVGYFGASTGAAAALVAASERRVVRAVVSRGGRPDLANGALDHVRAPTLLIVGGHDVPVITLNRQALERLRCEKALEIVPGATHLFEEPGTLEQVASLARGWFERHLVSRMGARRREAAAW